MRPDYFYTKFGEIYSGYKWDLNPIKHSGYTAIIQASNLEKFRGLPSSEMSLEDISKYGWVLSNDVISGFLKGTEFTPPSFQRRREEIWSSSAFERKYMFVFGAGASANCVFGSDKKDFDDDALRPPLGTSLFDKKFKKYYEKYRGVKQSLHSLQGENVDVEELLENEWKAIFRQNNQQVLSRHINMQYYLQDILNEVSNRVIDEYYGKNLYVKFFDKLQKIYAASLTKPNYGTETGKNFALVSFNQDTILEHFACDMFDRNINSLRDYICMDKGGFSLFKPHGSWNWGWKFPNPTQFNGNPAAWLFANKKNFYELYFEILGTNIDMVDWDGYGSERMVNKDDLGKFTIDKGKIEIIQLGQLNNYFPAMLLPYRDKDEFTMPHIHLYKMMDYMRGTEVLVLIGWKGNEAAFNRLLISTASNIRKIIIVDPKADVVKKNLEELIAHRKAAEIITYETFESFVEEGVDKEII